MKEIPVEAVIDEGVIYPDIRESSNALYMMMLTTGYLKAIETWQDKRGRWWCRLQIPNMELRHCFLRQEGLAGTFLLLLKK